VDVLAERPTGTYQGTSAQTQCEQPNGVLDAIAWFCGNSGSTPHPAEGKTPNAWGLHDLLGNMSEWVHDWYAAYPGDAIDPWGPATGSHRVARGGDYDGWAHDARAASRYLGVHPAYRVYYRGFRLSRSIP
jgi:formylglycine-generating enzyme required for sulfatase activity